MRNSGPLTTAERGAQSALLLCAVRALIETHPNPAALRETWAHVFSMLQRDMYGKLIGRPETRREWDAAIARLMPIWESYFPARRP